MEFFRDGQRQGLFWVDRGLDGRVDHFEPCGICEAIHAIRDEGEGRWAEGTLCFPCNERLAVESAIADVRGDRPFRLASMTGCEAVMQNLAYLQDPDTEIPERDDYEG